MVSPTGEAPGLRLPRLLDVERAAEAVEALRCYYGRGHHADHKTFTGALFDTWAHGGHDPSPNHFTADDLIAVSLLAVHVPAEAAVDLLDTRHQEFGFLLRQVGPDRDLVEEGEPWSDDWAGWQLWAALRSLTDVGPTTASKLYARKRPRLRPIYDRVVARVIGTDNIWEPLRAQLTHDPALYHHLLGLRTQAELPETVSALRVFDVVAWMEGKGYTPCRWSA